MKRVDKLEREKASIGLLVVFTILLIIINISGIVAQHGMIEDVEDTAEFIKGKLGEVFDWQKQMELWEEECYEYETVEKYNIVQPIVCKEECWYYYITGGCAYNETICYEDETAQPVLEFYNETTCIKKILVKELFNENNMWKVI